MELKWNLDELFKSIEECYKAFEEIDKQVEIIQDYKSCALTKETLDTILTKKFACQSMAYRVQVYGALRYYANIKDEEIATLKNATTQKYNEVTARLAFIDEMILSEGEERIRSLLGEQSEYTLYIDDLFRRVKHNVTNTEKSQLQDEIDGLLKEYNDLISEVSLEPIDIDGKEVELTLGNVPKYLAAEDRETRRKAFESLNRAFEDITSQAAEILNEIYVRRIKIAKIEKYSSVLESALDKENIDPKIIDTLISAVHNNLHHLQKYMALKAKYMHLEEPHLYDLGVPIDFGNKRKYPLEEGLAILKDAFSVLGDNYTRIVEDLISNGHIDAIVDDNRHPSIVFSWLGYSFLSYKETYNDLKNLVHELGHSINDSLSMHLPFPYRISTVFTGETASITNEILLNRSLLSKAETLEEKVFYLSKEIDNFVISMYRQTLYTELEDNLYKYVEKGKTLTAEILNVEYLSLLKKYYGEDIVYDELSKSEWTRLGKLYRWAFYSYNYATGLLIANTVFAKLNDGSLPVEDYIRFLASGANEYSLDMLKRIGIDLSDPQVFERGFEVLEEDIRELERFLSATCEKRIELDRNAQ